MTCPTACSFLQLTLCKTASARWLTASAAAMAAVSAGSVIAAASAAIATAGASADASAVCAAPLPITGSGSWGLGLLVPAAAASCLQWNTSDGQTAVERWWGHCVSAGKFSSQHVYYMHTKSRLPSKEYDMNVLHVSQVWLYMWEGNCFY